jgi:hypothetical protein
LIWLEPRVVDRLRALRGRGESYSDVILLRTGPTSADPASGRQGWVRYDRLSECGLSHGEERSSSLTSGGGAATGAADQAGGDDARCEHQGEHEVRADRDAEQEVGRGADGEQLVALCLCVHDDFTYVIHGDHDCRDRPNGC